MNSLEALEKISNQIDTLENYSLNECVETIETDLKALEIIKEKQVDITRLTTVIFNCRFGYWPLNSKLKWYNSSAWFSEENFLELDEFIYLKDWLERQ